MDLTTKELYIALQNAQTAIREYREQGAPTALWDDIEAANLKALAVAEFCYGVTPQQKL